MVSIGMLAPTLLEDIRRSYRRATHALELPLSGGFEVFPKVTRIPFIARHSMRTRVEARGLLGLDSARPVALLSFGGYGLQRLAVEKLDCLDEWTVLLTDRITSLGAAPPAHVQLIPESAFAHPRASRFGIDLIQSCFSAKPTEHRRRSRCQLE